MNRQIVYPGQILPETTLLNMSKDGMIGLGKLAAAVFGTGTFVNGLTVAPNSPAALNVVVAPGEIYSMQNIDGAAFSSLAADTAHQIVKQGVLLDAITLATAAPATAGQSINYLIQATFSEVDDTPVLLPYYNSTNPSQAYSGPGNNGVQQATRRAGTVIVSAKAGISATTGSQVTPAPDSGYVGLYVVTVANGQTTVTAPNISMLATAPYAGNIAQATETNPGTAKVATQAITNTGTDDTTIVTPSKLFNWVKQATETLLGMLKVATQALTDAGVSDTTAVTPKKLRNGFAISLGANGYIAFPSWLGGLIVQWGQSPSITQNAAGTITFPLAFPNACYVVLLTDFSTGANVAAWRSDTPTLANVSVQNQSVLGAAATRSCFFIAIGK